MMNSAQSNLLQCRWSSVTVTADSTLDIHLPAFNCTDMTGAIAFAKRIMPTVRRINVLVDGAMDTVYYRHTVRAPWEFHDRRGT